MPQAKAASRTPAIGTRAGKRAGARGETAAIYLFAGRQRFAVEPELLDLGGAAEVVQLGLEELAREGVAQLLARLLKAWRLAGAAVLDLDHVPAELALDRCLAVLTGRDRKH